MPDRPIIYIVTAANRSRLGTQDIVQLCVCVSFASKSRIQSYGEGYHGRATENFATVIISILSEKNAAVMGK